MKFFALGYWPLVAGCVLSSAAIAANESVAANPPLEEVVVTAALRDLKVADLPQSVTVLDSATLRQAGVQHFGDVLGLIPNLNWASGTSRPRYFQLRGIGETEQYQGAPNPSVGFLIDDIDFSGVGMPATLFDVSQIEVLRGPQGTAYGASALAGLISVRTRDPGTEFDLHGEATVGDYGTRSAGIALGDGLDGGQGGWRIAAQQYRGNGFRHDAYLNRDDTNGYDEGTLRGKLFWQLTPALRADLVLMHVDLNNGYDAWSADNSFTTQSNQPGRDAQRSSGAALKLVAQTESFGEWRSVTTAADSRIVYSFDADWGNDVFWAAQGYSPYDYFEQNQRRRRTLAEDLRFVGDDAHELWGRVRWLAGAYVLQLTESDDLLDTWNDAIVGTGSNVLLSHYRARNIALYGSFDTAIGARSSLTLGLRGERRVADYADTTDAPFQSAADKMLGGNLSWLMRTSEQQNLYATLARGYKAGGFNIGSDIMPQQRRFQPEYLWSMETGLKRQTADSPLQLQADVFYMRREHMQAYTSQQLDPSNPATFVFFTQNIARGENYGLESDAHWYLTPRWQLSGSAALLHTRYLGFEAAGLAINGQAPTYSPDGRAQAYAPEYQLSAALEYRHPTGWFTRLDAWATDGFYFSASHDQTARAYQLVNLRGGYQHGSWSVSAWARNLLNQRYAVQGFYFGLEPPNYPTKLYLQNGDPRQLGVTIGYDVGRAKE